MLVKAKSLTVTWKTGSKAPIEHFLARFDAGDTAQFLQYILEHYPGLVTSPKA